MNTHRIAINVAVITLLLLCPYLFVWQFSWDPIPLPWRRNAKNPIPTITDPAAAKQKDWQPVSGSDFIFSVYSAYCLADSYPPEVLIVGVTATLSNETINCQFHFHGDSSEENLQTLQIPGTIQTMEEYGEYLYAGSFIRCPLPYWNNQQPTTVSVLANNSTTSSNSIKIQYQEEAETKSGVKPYQFDFSVCVLPAYKYNEVFHFLEWIEFYKMMGVKQFTMYNVSIGPDTSCILNDLMNGGDPSIKVNVHPWHNHPIKNDTLIRSGPGGCADCSLSAGANECLHRHRGGLTKYLVFVDFDEFIMPNEEIAKNFSELIHHLDFESLQDPRKKVKNGQYLFRNGFFVRSRPNDPLLTERCDIYQGDSLKWRVCLESFMMKKYLRDDLDSYTWRTKYIVKPEGVKMMGNHWANQFEEGYGNVKVPKNVAISRHYRRFEEKGQTENDRMPLRVGLKLVGKLAERVEHYRNICNVNLEL